MVTTADAKIAVLIDYENTGLDPLKQLFDQLSNVGRVLVRRAYADWSAVTRPHKDDLLALAIEPIQLFRTTTSGKNASDLRLTIDAMDLLNAGIADTFVIVSSDSDFVPLVNRLHAAGKTVIGAGRQDGTAQGLVKSCDRFLYFEAREKDLSSVSEKIMKEEPVVVRAVRASMDQEGRVNGAKLHETMQRLDPGFNFRTENFKTFSKYLEAQSEVHVKKSRGLGDIIVELAEQGGPQ